MAKRSNSTKTASKTAVNKNSVRKSSKKKSFISSLIASRKFKKFAPIAAVLIFAAVGSYLVFFSKAATVTLATVEAESMALPLGGNIVPDGTASGGRAIVLNSNGNTTGQFSIASPGGQITIRAKGSQCRGAPQMVVSVDGGRQSGVEGGVTSEESPQTQTFSVSSTAWTDYTFNTSIASGSHSLSISFTNHYARKNCSRTLYIDKSTIYGVVSEEATGGNLAAGKPVTTNASYADQLPRITDGDLNTASYANLNEGPRYVQIDLGQQYSVGKVNLWHYFGDGRTYRDVIVQLSNTADFSSGTTTIFNNDRDSSAGQGAGGDSEYPENSSGKSIIPATAVNARYVRFWSNGSSVNPWNHYVEAQVFAAGSVSATPSTPPPSPTPTPTPAPSTTGALSWRPPALTSPQTVTITSTNRDISLSRDQDYIIKLGHITNIGGLKISGGRNVVLIGGHITIPYAGAGASPEARRGLILYDQTGTVHVEGLLIDGPDLSEGIQIGSSPDAPQLPVVQLQNVRIIGVHARDQVGFTDNHPDCVQPWGGAREIRIDRMTCTTDAHGMYFDAADSLARYRNIIGPIDVRRYNMKETYDAYPWTFLRITRDWRPVMTLTDVYVEPYPGKALARDIGMENWTGSTKTPSPVTISSDGTIASWPQALNLTGVVKKGPPPGGDFVPDGRAGEAYVSTGYL